MNVNVNLLPRKKGFIKRILILILFSLFCFFIKENVFAASSTSAMPNFLEEYYSINKNNYSFTCDDYTQSYCVMYNDLSQFFAEFHTLYHNVVFTKSSYSAEEYVKILFYLDKPYTNLDREDEYIKNKETLLFSDDTGEGLAYYQIHINKYMKTVSIKYSYNAIPQAVRANELSKEILKTNFDLYSVNNLLFHMSDVVNFAFIDVPEQSGIALVPKKNSNGTSYINYDKENIYGAWYNIEKDKFENFIKYDKPVSSDLTYELGYSSLRYNSDRYYILNRGTTTAEIGYVADDFDIIIYEDFTSLGIDSSGNNYDNPLNDLDKEINDSIWFSSEESILDNVVRFFSNFGNYLLNLGNNIVKGISNALQTLGSFIINGIKDLFIPGEELEGFFEEEYEYLKQQLGFLIYPIEVVIDFADRVYKLDNSNSAVFNIPKLEIFNKTIYEGTSFDLMTIVNKNQAFKNIYNIYRVAISGFIVLWLVQLAVKKEHEIFGGGIE